jgi:hypothetical protein
VLKRHEVEERFKALLVEEGVDLKRPAPTSVAAAWAAMGRFRAEQVEGAEGDSTSASYGVHEQPNGEVFFELTMARALSFYDGDAYDVTMHLYCSFQYEPIPALRTLGDGGTVFDEPVDPY